eukprot:PhF_6_TR7215/c0_g2_i2/m.10780
MDNLWFAFPRQIRQAIGTTTIILHMCADYNYFTPWDILDDLGEYLGSPTYITTIEEDNKEEIRFSTSVTARELNAVLITYTTPFHIHLALHSLPDSFLVQCSKLVSLDTSGLTYLTSIGDDFLSNCASLTAFDTSGLENVTSVGNNFLAKCTSLKALDLLHFTSVKSIGSYFLAQCGSLPHVDTSNLTCLTSIGTNFLFDCTSLTSLHTR